MTRFAATARKSGAAIVRRALCALAVALATAVAAQATETNVETRIKAAFLYHFCNYVDWPESAFGQADSPLVLGVMGSESMTGELSGVVASRVAHERPMTVRTLRPGDSLDGLHLLFVAESAKVNMNALLAAAAEHSVLVVTEEPEGLEAGGAINFIVENDRVRFDIAPEIARRSKLGVSAQLLTVARMVKEDGD
ncbi:MAG TPA: YfiR family protein [Gammaproteobacteria bacterium]